MSEFKVTPLKDLKEEIDVVTAGCLAKGSSTPTSLYSEESQIGKT